MGILKGYVHTNNNITSNLRYCYLKCYVLSSLQLLTVNFGNDKYWIFIAVFYYMRSFWYSYTILWIEKNSNSHTICVGYM